MIGSPDGAGVGTVFGDIDPAYDDCSDNSHTTSSPIAEMAETNVGDLLTNAGVSWTV